MDNVPLSPKPIETLPMTPDQRAVAYKWKAMATMALGTMMGTMDSSITNISFPLLTKTFGALITTIVWVSLAYILASTSLMLILGLLFSLKAVSLSFSDSFFVSSLMMSLMTRPPRRS